MTPHQWLWHQCLSRLNFDTINLLSKNDIVTGLPKLKFVKDHLCSLCELGKAKRSSFKTKTTPSLKGRLHLLHMDLCGPMQAPNPKVNVPIANTTKTTSLKELEILFGPIFVEYFNGATQVVSKSFAVTTTDVSDKRQQPNITPSTSTTVVADITQLDIQTTHEPTTQAPTVNADENINQVKNVMFDEDEFINSFGTPVHEVGESSYRHVDPSNIHTFYQRHPSKYR
ncbi:retrovirus-related pol polyprotein from transposon TNT 1-94 [Tanacetum coccineum]